MKLLLIGGLVTVGIVVAGVVTMHMLEEDVNEQPLVTQSTKNEQTFSNAYSNLTADKTAVQDSHASTLGANDSAQSSITVSLYGNLNQSGTRLHQAINDLLLEGQTVETAILNAIDAATINQGSDVLSPEALTTTQNHKPTTADFMSNMVEKNDLFAATKSSIEIKPKDINNIIDVSVVLYPDFAQEVINAAVLTGEIDSNSALLAAIAAGADPSTVSEATAAGGNVVSAAQPLNGIGGGGIGNEDISASNN